MIFFVDYENVGDIGLHGIESLTAEDKVYIVYTKTNKMSVKVISSIFATKVHIEFFESPIGHNAADFALVSLMYLLSSPTDEIYLVSQDMGFQGAIEIGSNFDYSVTQCSSIANRTALNKSDLLPSDSVEFPMVVPKKSISGKSYQEVLEKILKKIPCTKSERKKIRKAFYATYPKSAKCLLEQLQKQSLGQKWFEQAIVCYSLLLSEMGVQS